MDGHIACLRVVAGAVEAAGALSPFTVEKECKEPCYKVLLSLKSPEKAVWELAGGSMRFVIQLIDAGSTDVSSRKHVRYKFTLPHVTHYKESSRANISQKSSYKFNKEISAHPSLRARSDWLPGQKRASQPCIQKKTQKSVDLVWWGEAPVKIVKHCDRPPSPTFL